MADIELSGLNEVLTNLEKKLGNNRVNRVVNKSLKSVGVEAEQDLKSAVAVFKDTGKTQEEITASNVSRAHYGIPTIKIGWGPGSGHRWRLEHLNEFGYTRHGRRYSPRGLGVVRQFVDIYGSKYPQKMEEELKELMK